MSKFKKMLVVLIMFILCVESIAYNASSISLLNSEINSSEVISEQSEINSSEVISEQSEINSREVIS